MKVFLSIFTYIFLLASVTFSSELDEARDERKGTSIPAADRESIEPQNGLKIFKGALREIRQCVENARTNPEFKNVTCFVNCAFIDNCELCRYAQDFVTWSLVKAGVRVLRDIPKVVFEGEQVELPIGSFLAEGEDIRNFMTSAVNGSDFVISLYTPHYKQRSRLCGKQAFHQAVDRDGNLCRDSGVHFEIRAIRDRQNTNKDDLNKAFHRGFLLVGSQDKSVPQVFSETLNAECVTPQTLAAYQPHFNNFDIKECSYRILDNLRDFYRELDSVTEIVQDYREKLAKNPIQYLDQKNCTCRTSGQAEDFVIHNINVVETYGQAYSEYIWRKTFKDVKNCPDNLINIHGPDFIGKKQMLYALARRWVKQNELYGYKLIWFLNGASQSKFHSSCNGLREAFLVNDIMRITEKSLFVVFDVETEDEWDQYRACLPPASDSCRIIALSRQPLQIDTSFKMSVYQLVRQHFLSCVESTRRIIGWFRYFF